MAGDGEGAAEGAGASLCELSMRGGVAAGCCAREGGCRGGGGVVTRREEDEEEEELCRRRECEARYATRMDPEEAADSCESPSPPPTLLPGWRW